MIVAHERSALRESKIVHHERKSSSSRSLSTALIGEFMTVVGSFANFDFEAILGNFIFVDLGLEGGLLGSVLAPDRDALNFSAAEVLLAGGKDGLFSFSAGESGDGGGFFDAALRPL